MLLAPVRLVWRGLIGVLRDSLPHPSGWTARPKCKKGQIPGCSGFWPSQDSVVR